MTITIRRRAALGHTCIHQQRPGQPVCGRPAAIYLQTGSVVRPVCGAHDPYACQHYATCGWDGDEEVHADLCQKANMERHAMTLTDADVARTFQALAQEVRRLEAIQEENYKKLGRTRREAEDYVDHARGLRDRFAAIHPEPTY